MSWAGSARCLHSDVGTNREWTLARLFHCEGWRWNATPDGASTSRSRGGAAFFVASGYEVMVGGESPGG